MRLIDVVSGEWAITNDMLHEIHNIYDVHLRGDKIHITQIEAAIGRPLANSRQGAEIIDNVAIIKMQGTIAKRMNLMTQVSGGVSSQIVMSDIKTALDDDTVKGIILDIDSPGGTVDGTAELAEMIYESRGKKPIITYSDGMIASAAYWIASATDGIYISGETNPVGSIGVVSGHRDYSGAEAKAGIKTTEITAGKYKRITSQYEPLTEEGRSEIQGKLDYQYKVFVDTVARNRGVSSETVLNDMADGRVFIGKQAISAGLVDGVSTIPELIEIINKNKTVGATVRKGKAMTKEQIKAEYAEAVEEIITEAKAGMIDNATLQSSVATAKAEGQQNAIDLVSATMGEEIAGKLSTLMQAGISAEQAKTLNIKIDSPSVTIDEKSRADILSALHAVAPEGIQTVASGKTDNDERKAVAAMIAAGAITKNTRRA